MTTFCVYGVSKTKCKLAAEKKVPLSEGKPARALTMPEWLDRVNKECIAQFESETARIKQISPAFDTPQFAAEWIELGKRGGEILHPKIMVKGQKIDAKGDPVVRKGKKVIGWIPYKETA